MTNNKASISIIEFYFLTETKIYFIANGNYSIYLILNIRNILCILSLDNKSCVS